jgi:Protein of unknown function (DUF1592)/Protein of unknown function (DUF1588)/Protein of unknown function (DUF1595)/Protein of unknown function (DUF1587)/Protein of unknown function (DUF1585)
MRVTYMRGYGHALSALICLLAAPGCTGAISGSPGSAESSAGQGTGATSNGTGGSAGASQSAQCTPAEQSQVSFRVLTRLNRAEYDNTVRDLLGDTTHAALTTLPADFGDGAFDNNADALSIDPSLAQTFEQLAETLAESAFAAGSPGRNLVLTCSTTDEACAKQISSDFAVRAWRRPLQDGELDRLFALYTAARTAGFSFEQGLQTVVEAALTSPNFLFRPELDATPDAPTVHAVSPYELSSRLSYLLWSSMPDAALQASAASGELATPAGLQTQLTRMWASPNAEAFFQRFPGQWLHTLNVTIAKQPAAEVFPNFNASLQAAMEGETAHFMRELLTTDTDILSMLDAKFTYLNAPLAQFYGIPGQFTNDFVRVDLTGNAERGGILTQAAFLTVTSPPERTSPVMRGQWVLARMLNAPPPAPPNNIPSIDAQTSSTPQTMRQKMTAHAANPTCAACHSVMDPIGFGLENYDGIGQWRSTDNGIAVDPSGQLDASKNFNGALQLEQILKTDARVPRAIVQYLLSYALGRELGDPDKCLLDDVTSAFQAVDKNRMQALVKRIVALPVMQSRRGAP